MGGDELEKKPMFNRSDRMLFTICIGMGLLVTYNLYWEKFVTSIQNLMSNILNYIL